MPYCPRCDIEYKEGIVLCNNCNQTLLPSKESLPEEPEQSFFTSSPTFISKANKYEDLKSSAFAFFIVGSLLLIYSGLSLLGVFNIPIVGLTRTVLNTAILIIGAVFLIIAIKSYFLAKGMRELITKEENQTDTLITWFLANYNEKDLDAVLDGEFDELTPEERALKRLDLIQDYLITHHDLTDDSYTDNLCEQIYTKVFE